jgi:small subunit ribosomal protein S20
MKRARQNETRRLRNRVYRSAPRTYIKTARKQIEAGELEEAQTTVAAAIKSLDKAVQKGLIHKNNAARQKSRLTILLNKAQAGS